MGRKYKLKNLKGGHETETWKIILRLSDARSLMVGFRNRNKVSNE